MADKEYNFKITLSNGQVLDAGNFTAPQGPKGDTGAAGNNLKTCINIERVTPAKMQNYLNASNQQDNNIIWSVTPIADLKVGDVVFNYGTEDGSTMNSVVILVVANIVNQNDSQLNFRSEVGSGLFAQLEGPQGPQGAQGPRGATGANGKDYLISSGSSSNFDLNVGDAWSPPISTFNRTPQAGDYAIIPHKNTATGKSVLAIGQSQSGGSSDFDCLAIYDLGTTAGETKYLHCVSITIDSLSGDKICAIIPSTTDRLITNATYLKSALSLCGDGVPASGIITYHDNIYVASKLKIIGAIANLDLFTVVNGAVEKTMIPMTAVERIEDAVI